MPMLPCAVGAMMELPGALACAVVEVESGECLARSGAAVAEEIEKACLINARFLRASAQMASNRPGESIEDVLITLGSEVHLIRLVPRVGRPDLFSYLVMQRAAADVPIARLVVAQIGRDYLGADDQPLMIPILRRVSAPRDEAVFDDLDEEEIPAFMRDDVAMKLLGITLAEDEVLPSALCS